MGQAVSGLQNVSCAVFHALTVYWVGEKVWHHRIEPGWLARGGTLVMAGTSDQMHRVMGRFQIGWSPNHEAQIWMSVILPGWRHRKSSARMSGGQAAPAALP